jgi:cytosine/adenosine deaminase-related metal-dependent hydrolase
LDVTLVWSPRSNLSLYGETIDLRESQRQGVRLALGTDWSPSGSFNMLEEFSCARAVAQKIAAPLDAHQLWLMATLNAAYAAGIDDVVGQLAEGLYGDLVLLRKREGLEAYAVAINATVDDVALVWLDGKPIFADSEIARQMGFDSGCEALTAEDKVMCADFAALGMSWEDIVTLTADAVPMNGDTSRQALCDVADPGEQEKGIE